jgi:phage/plasmid-associated DNA primase
MHTVWGLARSLSDETDQIERVAEAKLKAFTGSTSKFYFDVKGKRGFSAPVTARIHILSNNGLPIYDRSSALVERILHLQFEKSFIGREDRGLKSRLYREIDGIFNWALAGYTRIANAPREFTVPARSAKALQHYREQSNPFKVWFEEMIEVTRNPADLIIKLEVLTRHNEWLKERGHRAIADNTCARQIRLIVSDVSETRVTGQVQTARCGNAGPGHTFWK